MKFFKNIIFSLIIISIVSCNSAKTLKNESNKTNDIVTIEDAIEEIATGISRTYKSEEKIKLIVAGFSSLYGDENNFGELLAEEITTQLIQNGKFIVIERRLLEKISKEHQLNITGLIDETTSKELGKILGAEGVLSGTITEVGDYLRISARIIEVESGIIQAASSSKIKREYVKLRPKPNLILEEKPNNQNNEKQEISLVKIENNEKELNLLEEDIKRKMKEKINLNNNKRYSEEALNKRILENEVYKFLGLCKIGNIDEAVKFYLIKERTQKELLRYKMKCEIIRKVLNESNTYRISNIKKIKGNNNKLYELTIFIKERKEKKLLFLMKGKQFFIIDK